MVHYKKKVAFQPTRKFHIGTASPGGESHCGCARLSRCEPWDKRNLASADVHCGSDPQFKGDLAELCFNLKQ